jgi:hypothetical protein
MEPADLDINLDDLVNAVDGFRPDGDDIDRLRTAVTFAERLGDLGDQLVGTFVDRARRAGASWREIGDGLGVSKQAAQKRFVSATGEGNAEGFLSRFTPRAREVLTVAGDTARRLGQTQVRTEHLVVGLVHDPEGLSARALAAQGLDAAAVGAAVDAASPRAGEPPPGHIPFAAEGKKVLENALREAFSRRHNYIGTEHLLLGLLAERRSTGAKVLRQLGATQDATAEWLDGVLAELAARKRSPGS